jgi:hypothetical protein
MEKKMSSISWKTWRIRWFDLFAHGCGVGGCRFRSGPE